MLFENNIMSFRYFNTIIFLINFVFVTRATYNYLTKNKKKEERCKAKEIHEAIMFRYETEATNKSKYSRCMISKSMDRVLYYLSQPKYTLDICMYVWTNMDITNAILKLHFRGVKIRVIIDADMAFSSGSAIRRLEKQRIPVRWRKSTNLMHHKFCLADTSSKNPLVTPFLMAGSLNWTNQALWGNYENCVVTSQKQLVEGYQQEFEELWELFKPIVN